MQKNCGWCLVFFSNFNKVLSRFICIEQPDCKLLIHHPVYADCFETHLLPPVFLILVPLLLKFERYWVSWIEIYDDSVTNWLIRFFLGAHKSLGTGVSLKSDFLITEGILSSLELYENNFKINTLEACPPLNFPSTVLYGDRKTEWLVANAMIWI